MYFELSKLGFEKTGEWNNREFWKFFDLEILEHCGDLYWNIGELCYDYPIKSTDILIKLVNLYTQLHKCKSNPENTTLLEYNNIQKEIKNFRKELRES